MRLPNLGKGYLFIGTKKNVSTRVGYDVDPRGGVIQYSPDYFHVLSPVIITFSFLQQTQSPLEIMQGLCKKKGRGRSKIEFGGKWGPSALRPKGADTCGRFTLQRKGSPRHHSSLCWGPIPHGRLKILWNLGDHSLMVKGEAHAETCLGSFVQRIPESQVPKTRSTRAEGDSKWTLLLASMDSSASEKPKEIQRGGKGALSKI